MASTIKVSGRTVEITRTDRKGGTHTRTETVAESIDSWQAARIDSARTRIASLLTVEAAGRKGAREASKAVAGMLPAFDASALVESYLAPREASKA